GRHTIFSRDWSSDVCSSDLAFSKNHSYLSFILVGATAKWTKYSLFFGCFCESVTMAIQFFISATEILAVKSQPKPLVICNRSPSVFRNTLTMCLLSSLGKTICDALSVMSGL